MRDEISKEDEAERRKALRQAEMAVDVLESDKRNLERKEKVLEEEVRQMKIEMARLAAELKKKEGALRLFVDALTQLDEDMGRAKKHRETL